MAAISTAINDLKDQTKPMNAPVSTPITPEIVAQHGLKPDEYQRLLQILGARAVDDGAWHLLGDVERALLL